MSNEEIARAFYEAINQRDMKGLTAHVSDKCKYVDVAQGKTTTGKEVLRKDCELWLAGFPDGKVQLLDVVPAGDSVVVEYVGRGTHTGPLGTGAEAIQPTNKKVELRFCDVLRFQNGELIGLNSYYDLFTLMRQIGLAEQIPTEAKARPEARPH